IGLHSKGNQIVYQTVFIGEVGCLKFVLELLLVNGLEDVLKAAVVFLQNRVLRRQVNGQAARKSVIKARARKAADGLVDVIHGKGDAGTLEFEHFIVRRRRSVPWRKRKRQGTRFFHNNIGGAVLIAKGVTAHNNRL